MVLLYFYYFIVSGKNATPKLGSLGAPRTNSLEDVILRNNGVKENGSLVISNDFLTQKTEPEIKSALSNTANHIMAAATPTVLKSKPESINRSESIPRKRGRNRRNNKHTKSCELDFSSFPEELQKSLMNAANGAESQNSQSPKTTPATTPATTPSDGKERKWPTVNSESRVETNTLSGGSLKKKGHRRSKSHGTAKMMITNDTKTGQYYLIATKFQRHKNTMLNSALKLDHLLICSKEIKIKVFEFKF